MIELASGGAAGSAPDRVRPGAAEGRLLDEVSSGFGLSAAVTVVFNTVLAWARDGFAPLNGFMASLTGNPWIAHGLADVIVFLLLGYVLTRRGARADGYKLAAALIAAALVGGAGLTLWFVLF